MSFDAIVVGAGFAGLYAVHRCVSEGLTVLGIEAAPSVGGTWYWNRYPGARCDVESVDYSYAFDADLRTPNFQSSGSTSTSTDARACAAQDRNSCARGVSISPVTQPLLR